MKNTQLLKEKLLKACFQFVENKMQMITKTIASNQQALQSETKSSAGDKHETGRAMLQLEIEKAGQQFKGVQQMKETLSKIELSNDSKNVHLGSLVLTNQGNYFIAISAGMMQLEDAEFFVISTISPIGKLLLGSSKGSVIEFNSKQIKVQNIL